MFTFRSKVRMRGGWSHIAQIGKHTGTAILQHSLEILLF